MKKTQRSWNSTLRTKSPKRRRLESATSKWRSEYKAEFTTCQRCVKKLATDLHEICRGAHREQALQYPELWLCLCQDCHEELGDYSKWPLARQLALKLVSDPGRVSLEVFNEVRGRAESAMTLADVAVWLEVK